MEITDKINKLFYDLKDNIQTTIIIRTHTKRILKPINENSSLGEQIKYYRMQQDIKQTDLSLKLGYSRDALHHIENKEMKLIDINLIKDIIKELDIKDKLIINDEYIEFLLDSPCERILNIRKNMQMTRQEFADMLDVSITSVRRWELGNTHISRNKYNKLKRCMN